MKIQYASDLHLEFSENYSFLKNNPLKISGDILVLAGDIGVLTQKSYRTNTFWNWAADSYQKVYVVPGNHEFYCGYDLARMSDETVLKIRDNVELHYNSVVSLNENTKLILSTLWAKVSEKSVDRVLRDMNDFRYIKYEKRRLTVENFNQEHEKCLNFIKIAVSQKNCNYVIATHHLPVLKVVPVEYSQNPVTDAYASNQLALIENNPNISHWIYGHSHANGYDTKIGNTYIISNQFGYAKLGEYTDFNPEAFFEI